MSELAPKFAEAMFAYHETKCAFEDALMEVGFHEYGKIGGDWYDCSIEFYDVENNVRMSEAAQRIVADAGFFKAYVNHKDGWETHYSWKPGEPFKPYRGWRRRYVQDPTAKTTNVIVGAPNPGYFEISYWPESWGEAQKKKDLSSGYMRIVPDPLDSAAILRPSVSGEE